MDPQILQFYGPLVGLVGFSFALGILWQRVKAVEKSVFRDDDLMARMIKLEVQGTAQSAQLSKIETSVEGVHREINELFRSEIRATTPAVKLTRQRGEG